MINLFTVTYIDTLHAVQFMFGSKSTTVSPRVLIFSLY